MGSEDSDFIDKVLMTTTRLMKADAAKRNSTPITLVLLFAALALSHAEAQPTPSLDRAAREGIIAAANQAIITRFMRDDRQVRKGPEIPKELWGERITRLKPLRVLDDRVNVFIVLKEDGETEEGLYVSLPISSYLPRKGKRFLVLERLSEPGDKAYGVLYHCKIKRAQSTAMPKAALPHW